MSKLNQKIAFSILCAKQVYQDPLWNLWADKWLDGSDRSSIKAAYVANAADATDAAFANAASTSAYAANAAAYATNIAAYAANTADVAFSNAASTSAAFIANKSIQYVLEYESNIDLLDLAEQALKY